MKTVTAKFTSESYIALDVVKRFIRYASISRIQNKVLTVIWYCETGGLEECMDLVDMNTVESYNVELLSITEK